MNPLEVVKEASKTAFNVAEHAVKTASFFAVDEKKNERIKICQTCPEYILEKDKILGYLNLKMGEITSGIKQLILGI